MHLLRELIKGDRNPMLARLNVAKIQGEQAATRRDPQTASGSLG